MNTWDETRSRLNHDILRNQVLNEVMALEHNPSEDCPRLKMWIKNLESYEFLLRDAEKETTYARVLEDDLFSCYEEDMKKSVRYMFHRFFLCKTNLREKIDQCQNTLDEAKNAVIDFVQEEPFKRNREEIRKFSIVLFALSNQISALPYSIDASN